MNTDEIVEKICAGFEAHVDYTERAGDGAYYAEPVTWFNGDDVKAAIYDLVAVHNCMGCQEKGPKLCADIPALEGICLRRPL